MKKFVWLYLALAVVFWIYLGIWGANSYRGFAYNFIPALLWPTVLFPSIGKGIGVLVILGVVGYLTFFKKVN